MWNHQFDDWLDDFETEDDLNEFIEDMELMNDEFAADAAEFWEDYDE